MGVLGDAADRPGVGIRDRRHEADRRPAAYRSVPRVRPDRRARRSTAASLAEHADRRCARRDTVPPDDGADEQRPVQAVPVREKDVPAILVRHGGIRQRMGNGSVLRPGRKPAHGDLCRRPERGELFQRRICLRRGEIRSGRADPGKRQPARGRRQHFRAARRKLLQADLLAVPADDGDNL